jgi:hypothetical protein
VSPAQRKRILYLSVALLAAALVIVAMVAVGALNDSGPPSAAAVQPTAIAETLLVPTLALTPTLAVPTAVPTSPPPTQRPSPTSTPSSDDSWEALQPAISAAWGSDWPKTIALLDGFLQSDPAYAPARSKQHDALLLYANDLIANGKPSDGISQIQRALQFVGDSGSNAPEPGAADVWQALQPTLSGLWGTDWVGTTALLEAFLERFPNYPDAVTKLYDALVSEGQDLLGQGSTDPAVAVLEQARSLQPDRPEAGSVLAALTPAPTPAPVRVVQPQPTPRPAVRQPVPAPAQPAPAPAQPAPAPAQPAPVVRQPPAPAAPAPAPTKCAFGTPGCGG